MNIQVATTDRFRKAFRSFREKEQKQIDEGINTYLIEPTNPSSNFEKLHFIDPNLNSIRVSEDIRIVLAFFDGVYFLLHVDRHDAAYNWGRNKRIDRNMTTGAIQLFTDAEEIEKSGTKQVEQTTEKPIFGHCSEEQLKVIGVPDGWITKIKSVSDEKEYENLWSYLPDDTIENLESVRDGFDIRSLVLQILDEYDKEQLPIKEQVVKQEGYELLTEDVSLADALKKDISLFRFYLHPSQKFLVEKNFKGPVKLTGTAGTGKTVVAMHRTRRLVDQLGNLDKPVFFTTYTKYLIKNIQSLFEEAKIPKEKLVVTNLHHYAVEYAQKLELLQGLPIIIESESDKLKLWKKFCSSYSLSKFTPEFLLNEYSQIIQDKHVTSEEDYLIIPREGQGVALVKSKRTELWPIFINFETFQRNENTFSFEDIIFILNKYLERWPDLKPFSHVICDEVQDFSNLELRLLRNLAPEGQNDLFLVGDPFQNIYKKRINFSKSGIKIAGKSYRLRINYRTTAEIQKLAFSAIAKFEFSDFEENKAIMSACESLVFGEEPEFKTFENEEQEFKFLADYIRKFFGQVGLHEICFATRTKEKRDQIKDYFKSQNFTCVNLEEISDLKETEGRIVLSTLHGLKGLEFKSLVVFNLSKDTFPHTPRGFQKFSEEEKAEFIKSEHALLYVSFSRAISHLMITGVGSDISFAHN
jgi:hypothetical protein